MFVQAIIINLTPILFIPLKEQLQLTYEQIGRLILINFATQVSFDLVCGALVDRIGAKPFAVLGHVFAFLGLALFALLPGIMPVPYHGLVIGTMVFSMGGGILELLLSPILNSLPSDQKASDMSLLHSFYSWGQMTVVLGTAIAIFLFDSRHWPWIALGWSSFALFNTIGFLLARIPPLVEEAKRQKLRHLIRKPHYLAAVFAIGLAGATEISISQWISAFADHGLGLPKIVGDLGGVCLFAAAMALGRTWFGLYGQKVDLHKYLLASAWACIGIFLVASLSPWPYVSLAACVAAGFGVSLLWPGILSLCSASFPLAGASMFALLAASGDTGAAIAPWAVGAIADLGPLVQGFLQNVPGFEIGPEQSGLRAGLFSATIYPVLLVVLLHWLGKGKKREAASPKSN